MLDITLVKRLFINNLRCQLTPISLSLNINILINKLHNKIMKAKIMIIYLIISLAKISDISGKIDVIREKTKKIILILLFTRGNINKLIAIIKLNVAIETDK